jgi:hypothetical protein
MRVITIADMANKLGTCVMDNMMYGERRVGSNLKWLKSTCPRKQYWSTFRRYTRKAFSPHIPPNRLSHYNKELKTPLGKWHVIARNI